MYSGVMERGKGWDMHLKKGEWGAGGVKEGKGRNEKRREPLEDLRRL